MSYYTKANEFYKNKDYINAIENYQKHIDDCRNNDDKYDLPVCLYNVGICYIKLREWVKAINYLTDALIYKKDSKYYYNLGYCYGLLDIHNEALKNFQKSLELNPYDEDCKKAINLINTKLDKTLDIENKISNNVIMKREPITFDKDLAKEYELIMLAREINITLDNGNRKEFIKLTNEYNQTIELIRTNILNQIEI